MSLFRFAHIEYLYGLIMIPLIILFFMLLVFMNRRNWKKWGEVHLLQILAPGKSHAKPVWKLIFFCMAYALIIIALANPQVGTRLEEIKREGVDVIIALDVSNSMNAEDIKPSRLERAKQAISRFIDKLGNDRIGIIVFAGNAYVQLPVTSDFSAAKLFLSTITSDLVPSQGTAIGTAIELSTESFVGKDNKHKTLIIITDGENHEDDALEAAKSANEKGIIIHTIGMGSKDGAPIPLAANGAAGGFLKDQEGHTVITKLDQPGLEKIAAEGKGIFVRASNSDDGLENIQHEIEKMNKKTLESKQFAEYEDRFQYFLGIGFLFLLLESMISNRKSKWLRKLSHWMSGK